MAYKQANHPSIEYCHKCDEPTGRAGRCEDSIYCNDHDHDGPWCESCWGQHYCGQKEYFESLNESDQRAWIAEQAGIPS